MDINFTNKTSKSWEVAYVIKKFRQLVVVVVVNSPHKSPRCGASRFRTALSIAIPLSVWSASISPAH